MRVPEGWETKKLGKLAKTVTSGSRDWAQYYAESGSKFIRMTNLRRDGIQLKLDDLKYVNVSNDSADGKRTALQNGDILISITAELGKIGWIPEGFGEAFINQHTALIRINQEMANSKFIAYLLSSKKMNQVINTLNDAGAKAGLNLPTIKEFKILLPPLYEQQKIAQILSTWDKAIEKLEALIIAKQKRKNAMMQQLLTGEIRFFGFKGEWETFHLGDLFEERTETRFNDLNLLSITREKGVIPRDEVERRDTSNEDKSKYLRICPGDIGYNTMRMWQGVSALSDLEGIVSPAYTVCKPRKNVDGRFISFLFKLTYLMHLFQRYSQGLTSDTWNLKFRHFSKIKVRIPMLLEQQKIATILSSADKEITTHKNQLTVLKQQKTALMQQLLTGKKRVNVCEAV
jgi:type I restriction enzyme S subunit